jgi:hypothetical protein
MSQRDRLILTCSCEGTVPVDAAALEKAGCGRLEGTANQLCRAELDRFRAALASGLPVTVACTQEQALFEEVAEETGEAELAFANIRETGGWSDEAKKSGPKAAALIAAAAEEAAPFEVVSMESAGVALVLGSDETAVEAARALAETLDITVLLTPGSNVTPPRRTTFPILQGRVARATGHLGAFELTVDAYAAPAPSSRRCLVFEGGRDGAVSRCDVVIDLTGGQPLFSAGDLRPGYYRANPHDPAAVARLIGQASHMVGTFDKPRFINFSADLCAHSRNRRIGCTRCLDLCPAGAISPAGDRCRYLRRLRPMCRRVPHRCGELRAADGRKSRTPPAHGDPGLVRRGRRDRAGDLAPRRGPWCCTDRCERKIRARAAGQRRAAPRQ